MLKLSVVCERDFLAIRLKPRIAMSQSSPTPFSTALPLEPVHWQRDAVCNSGFYTSLHLAFVQEHRPRNEFTFIRIEVREGRRVYVHAVHSGQVLHDSSALRNRAPRPRYTCDAVRLRLGRLMPEPLHERFVEIYLQKFPRVEFDIIAPNP